MLLECTTGNENTPIGSTRIHMFMVPWERMPGVETPLFKMTPQFNNQMGQVRQMQPPSWFPAAEGMRDEVGRWCTNLYDIPERAIIKVRIERRRSSPSSPGGFEQEVGIIFFQMRQSAPLYRMTLHLTGWNRASRAANYVIGRFDILGENQLIGYGAAYNPNLARFIGRPYPGLITMEQIEEAAAARVQLVRETITNSDGEEVSVVVPRHRRQLDLD